MGSCTSCAGCGGSQNCGGCRGCGALYLTNEELEALELFAALPFLPMGRGADEREPRLLSGGTRVSGGALLGLKAKGLITLDYKTPIAGFDYAPFEVEERGSMALTLRGQEALDALEIQGVSE